MSSEVSTSKIFCLIVLIGYVVSIDLAADQDDWEIRRFVPPQGTNFEEVRDIEMTDGGAVWFSSWGNGVARLEKSDWEIYSTESGDLPSDFVPTLAWDPENDLMWVGTDAGLVAILKGKAHNVPLPTALVDDSFEISLVHRFDSGELWIGAREGAVISVTPAISSSGVSFSQSRGILPMGEDHGYVVRGIVEGRDGSRWVARNRAGVMQLRDGLWTHHSDEEMGVMRSDALFEASDGTIWTSGSDSPSGFDGHEWTPIEGVVESKLLTEASDGRFYLSTVNGQIFGSSPNPFNISNPLRTRDHVLMTRVGVIKVYEGSLLWVGAKEGIFLGTRPRWRERSLHEMSTGNSGNVAFYSSLSQWPMILGMRGDLMRFDPESMGWNVLVSLPEEPGDQPGISAPQGGLCWIRRGREMFEVDLEERQLIRRVMLPEGFEFSDMLFHADGTLYIVGISGGFYLSDGEWVSTFSRQSIESIAMTKDRDILLALKNDIQRWRNRELLYTRSGENRNPSHPFTFVSESRKGGIFAGTRGLGLKVFDGNEEGTVDVRNSLLSSRILSAYESDNETLWIGFDNLGVAVSRPDRLVNYSADDGLRMGEVRFIGQDPKSDMWVAKSNGFIYRLEGDKTPPDTEITDGPPVIGHGDLGVVGFEAYDAWGHTKETELEFSWRLLKGGVAGGWKEVKEWSSYTSHRIVSLPRGLNRGSYRFEVRSQDRDFNTDPDPASHYFVVRPPMWATGLFLIPVGLLTVIAVGLALRLHSSHTELKLHSKQLDVEVKRRTEELELANDSLREEKERLIVTLRSIGDGLIVTNEREEIAIFNRAAERLIGVSEADVLGRRFSEIVGLEGQKNNQPMRSPVRLAISEGRLAVSDGDVMLRTKDGSSVDVSYSCAPIMDSDSMAVGCVFAVQDISHIHRLEEETVRASKLESLGLLAGGIAHDFNNFLTTIMGNLSYAKLHVESSSEIREILSESESASRQASKLTQQLLTFSKGGAPVKTKESIAEAIHHSVEFSLRGSVIKPTFDIASDLRSVEVDLGQLAQVLQNLSINATQAMPQGGGFSVFATNIDKWIDGVKRFFVQIQVVDEGGGISAEDLERVFDPYFSTKDEGNGLGLSVCYSIMKKHDGWIEIESRPNVGTTVTLTFPAREDSGNVGAERKSDTKLGIPLKALNILVMDDELGIRDLLSRMLNRMGHQCQVSDDGDSALQVYRDSMGTTRAFDVVILDLTVKGGKGGRETVAEILELDPRAVCIASSGYSEDPVLSDFRDFGFAEILKKPYGVGALMEVLDRAINSRI
ncbi:ATP-binding protein [bacterium]|nr:ATP-binding protein [bacterium]